MWIKTKDNNTLLNIIKFKVVKGFKNGEQGIIYGHYAGQTLFYSNMEVIATYNSYEKAQEVLISIENALTAGGNEVFQMK